MQTAVDAAGCACDCTSLWLPGLQPLAGADPTGVLRATSYAHVLVCFGANA